MNYDNIQQQEIAANIPVFQPELPTNSHQNEVNRKRQKVENRFLKASREVGEIPNSETVINNSKESLFSSNKISAPQMILIRKTAKGNLLILPPVSMQSKNTVLHTRTILLPALLADGKADA